MNSPTHFIPTSQPAEATGKKHQKNREYMKQENQYRLYKWLEQPNPFKDAKGLKKVVELASKELACFVSESGMIKACEVVGIEIPVARDISNPAKHDRAHIIAQQVMDLIDQLGAKPREDFLAVLAKQRQSSAA